MSQIHFVQGLIDGDIQTVAVAVGVVNVINLSQAVLSQCDGRRCTIDNIVLSISCGGIVCYVDEGGNHAVDTFAGQCLLDHAHIGQGPDFFLAVNGNGQGLVVQVQIVLIHGILHGEVLAVGEDHILAGSIDAGELSLNTGFLLIHHDDTLGLGSIFHAGLVNNLNLDSISVLSLQGDQIFTCVITQTAKGFAAVNADLNILDIGGGITDSDLNSHILVGDEEDLLRNGLPHSIDNFHGNVGLDAVDLQSAHFDGSGDITRGILQVDDDILINTVGVLDAVGAPFADGAVNLQAELVALSGCQIYGLIVPTLGIGCCGAQGEGNSGSFGIAQGDSVADILSCTVVVTFCHGDGDREAADLVNRIVEGQFAGDRIQGNRHIGIADGVGNHTVANGFNGHLEGIHTEDQIHMGLIGGNGACALGNSQGVSSVNRCVSIVAGLFCPNDDGANSGDGQDTVLVNSSDILAFNDGVSNGAVYLTAYNSVGIGQTLCKRNRFMILQESEAGLVQPDDVLAVFINSSLALHNISRDFVGEGTSLDSEGGFTDGRHIHIALNVTTLESNIGSSIGQVLAYVEGKCLVAIVICNDIGVADDDIAAVDR